MFIIGLVTNITSQTCSYTTTERGNFTEYVSKDGSVYKIGDRLTIGQPSTNKTFAFIQTGDGFISPIENAIANISGNETEIKRIFIVGTDRSGHYVMFRTKGAYAVLNMSINFEQALIAGEIKGFGKTSNEALTELKTCKDKLDLGLITQAEFDAKKTELTKYIK